MNSQASVVARPSRDECFAHIVQWLKPFVLPGEVYELRILKCEDNPKYGKFQMVGYFDSDHLVELAEAALQYTDMAEGCYVTMNPVNVDFLARAANRVIKATVTASDNDIVARHRITIDFDPERPGGISSTDEEKALAFRVGCQVRDDFNTQGWPAPIEGDSGNGYHLNYAIDLPVDDGGLVQRFLQALSAKYSTPQVKVDTTLFNPSRIIKLYGTQARKGDSIPARPHRTAQVIGGPSFLTVVDQKLIEDYIKDNPLPAPPEPTAKPGKTKAGSKATNQTAGHAAASTGGQAGGKGAVERCRKYLATIDAGIQGQNGSCPMYRAACAIARFGLLDDADDRQTAFDLLKEYGDRCTPPWTDKAEINHKLDDAAEKEERRDFAEAEAKQNGGSAGFVGAFPQVSPISVNLRPVPILDEQLLPDPLRSWIKDMAERACCPLDIPAMAAIVSIAVATGRKIAIRPKRHDDWTVVPNLWGMGVLPPGWLKTHCLEEPKKPLARLEQEARAKHQVAMKAHAVSEAVAAAQTEAAKAALKDRAKRKTGVEPATEAELRSLATEAVTKAVLEPPTLRRYIINDATVEKLGELLAENPDGLLLYRDELMGFLKGLERQGHEGDRAFYLEAWNGTGSYSYDRIGRGSLFIPSNTVSVLGGIQPGRLAAYIRDAGSGENDDGLISRFQLAVYPDVDKPFINIDRWPDTLAKNRAYAVFKSLAALDPGSIGATAGTDGEIPYLRFNDEAQAFFDRWRTDLETRVRSSREATNLISHLAKYRSLMPSLALLFHLIDGVFAVAHGPVSLTNAERAAAWCQYLEEHARRIYQAAFEGDPEPAQRLGERLKSSLQSPFKARDVLRKGWKGLVTKEEVDRAVSLLEEHGWLVRQEIPSDPQSGGRPTEEFHVNPAVLNGGVK